MRVPCIALLTDFGLADHYVASLKGVILSINPRAVIVDINHNVPSFDIPAGAFELFAAYRYFPPGTVFLAVVDPGVGSKRRILLARTEKYAFIAPDNGILSLALSREKVRRVRSVENPRYFVPRPSRTFDGRDKMAPAAAWLSRGAALSSFGPAVRDIVKWDAPEPRVEGAEISGSILYADKYGNLTTNISGEDLSQLAPPGRWASLDAFVAGQRIARFRETYGVANKGEPFLLVGSLGLVEIAARQASAGRRLRAGAGDRVRILRHG
jgi:S-adenosylmethionine hydrolase